MGKEYKLNLENFSCFLLALYYFANFVPLRIYGMGADNSKIRYYVLFAITIISIFLFVIKYKEIKFKKVYGKSLFYLVPVAVIFLIVSIYKAKNMSMSLNVRTYVQISLLLVPAIYSIFLLNFVSTKKIIFMMKFFLATTILLYFSEEEHTIFQFFNFSNYLNINKDILFTESSLCSETFFQLFAFFNFIRHIKEETYKHKKSLKSCMIISAIFTLLCNKRMTMLFVIIILLTNHFFDNQKETKKYFPLLFSIIFCAATYYYSLFVQNKLFLNLDAYSITTGRTYIMSLWANKNFFSYGYGTSMLVIGRYLEMDLVQIYMELNMLCVFLYSYALLKIANRKWYSFVMMFYVLLKLLTSVYLPMSFPWIILFIIVVMCSESKLEDENIKMESSQKIKIEVK